MYGSVQKPSTPAAYARPMAISIDTRTADGRLQKHETLLSDESGHCAFRASINAQRALGRTVTQAGDVCTVTDQAGALVLRIEWRKARLALG